MSGGLSHSAAAHMSLAERRAALRVGAGVIENRWPKLQAYVSISQGPNRLDAHTAFVFPGVVRVSLRYSGELVAQSLPGQPNELDLAACGAGTSSTGIDQ